MPFLLLVRRLRRVCSAHIQLLSLLAEFLDCALKMLTIICEFPFSALVAEEFDFAVCEFGGNVVVER